MTRVRAKTIKRSKCALLFFALTLTFTSPALASTCSYTDWEWHSESGQAVNIREVVTQRSKLSPEQSHPSLPCSICREDQVSIKVGDISTSVCHVIAQDVQEALLQAQDGGFEFNTLIGYRVGKSKGPLNAQGLRNQYSNHSFGLAIDINPERNGLYDRCIKFSHTCRLRRGGPWQPGTEGTITRESTIYDALTRVGLKWGGELQGRQKDFMHFSLNGD